jgi:hypothetical protein
VRICDVTLRAAGLYEFLLWDGHRLWRATVLNGQVSCKATLAYSFSWDTVELSEQTKLKMHQIASMMRVSEVLE